MAPPPPEAGEATVTPPWIAPGPRVRALRTTDDLGVRVRRLTWRGWLGIAVFIAGGALLAQALSIWAGPWWASLTPALRNALIGGGFAAGATALGTLPVLFVVRVRDNDMHAMLAFSAGVMFAASLFSLLLPAWSAAVGQGHAPWASAGIVAAACTLGVLGLLAMDRVSHRYADTAGAPGERVRTWLFVAAIVMHNVPEGLSIGVGYAGADLPQAHALAAAISLQDLPEGLVVALALRAVGHGRGYALGIGAISGLVEPVAALVGAMLVSLSTEVLPWGLAAAGGAMLFAIFNGIAPSLWRGERRGRIGLLVLGGIALMSAMDLLLA